MKGPFGLSRPFTSIEPFDDTISSEVFKVFENIPKWSKSASECTDFILDNFTDILVSMSKKTREDNIEVARSICFDGDNVRITNSVTGSEKSAPGASCDGSIRLVDIHTHPVGQSAYPSLTDINSSLPNITGLPSEFNVVIVRPERTPNSIEAYGTCLNLHSMSARCEIHKVNKMFRSGKESEPQRIVENKLIRDYGSTFEL